MKVAVAPTTAISPPYSMEFPVQAVIEKLPVAVYTCDPNGFISTYNEAAVELWGRRPEIGKDLWCGSWRIYRHDGSGMKLDECPMAMALKEGKPVYGHEIIIERPDGSRRFVAPYPNPLFNDNGEIIGAVNMLMDITETKKQEETSARFEAIVRHSEDAIVSKNTDGIVKSWNAAAERIFGFTAEEMIGNSILSVIPPDRQNEEPEILARMRKGERIEHFETKRITKDGRLIDLSLSISPIRDKRGNIIGISKIARDITPQRTAERLLKENDARFRMAIITTGIGTWEYSPLDGHLQWSDECRQIYGVTEGFEVDFDFFSKSIHPEDSAFVNEAVTKAMDPTGDGDYDIQFRILRYDNGNPRWIRSQGKVFFNDKDQPERFIGTVLDISADRDARQQLEDLVDERAQELKMVNAKLELSNKELEQFAYVASHDLQEPLRKVISFGDMIRNKYQDSIGAEGANLIERMRYATVRMQTLIDSLLSYSLLTGTDHIHGKVDLDFLVGEVTEDLEMMIRKSNATIKTGTLGIVHGDAPQLRQVFQNLLSNAIKFRKQDQNPVIEMEATEVRGSDALIPVNSSDDYRHFKQIVIRDNGIGFEQQYAHKIFELFKRLHGQTDFGGSGIGLSIVHKIVHFHNGYAAAKGEPGKGAEFILLFPV